MPMAALLVRSGAVLTTQNHNGQTPAEVASQPRMVSFFASLGPAPARTKPRSGAMSPARTEAAAVAKAEAAAAAAEGVSRPAKLHSGRSVAKVAASPPRPRLLDLNPRPEEFGEPEIFFVCLLWRTGQSSI